MNRNQNIGSIVKLQLIPSYKIETPETETINLSQCDIPPGDSFDKIDVADDSIQYNLRPKDTPNGTLYEISLSFRIDGLVAENRLSYTSKVRAWITDVHDVNLLLPAAKLLPKEEIGKRASDENAILYEMSVTVADLPKFLVNDGYPVPPVEEDPFEINKAAGVMTFETQSSDFSITIGLASYVENPGRYYLRKPDGTTELLTFGVVGSYYGGEYTFNFANMDIGVFALIPEGDFYGLSGYAYISKFICESAGIQRAYLPFLQNGFSLGSSNSLKQVSLRFNNLIASNVNEFLDYICDTIIARANANSNGWSAITYPDINVKDGNNAAPSGDVRTKVDTVNNNSESATLVISHNGSETYNPE